MTKKALIVTGSLAQDHEFIYPFYRLKEENIDTVVFNGDDKQVLGILGTKIPPQKDDKLINLNEINVDDFDLLIIPGGVKAMEHMRLEKKIINLIKDFDKKKKYNRLLCLEG